MISANTNERTRPGTGNSAASTQVDEHDPKGAPESESNCQGWQRLRSAGVFSALSPPRANITSDTHQIAPDVSNQHPVVKDVDRPNNPKPTRTAVFHSLGAGMVIAWGTNLLLTSTALIISTANFLNSDAIWTPGLALCCSLWSALGRLADRFLPSEKYKELFQASTNLASQENERVRKIVDKLDSDGKFAHTTIIPTEKASGFQFVDRFGAKDVLFFNPSDSVELNERELENIIAHELAHANKLYTGMLDTGYLMTMFAVPATFLSTFVSTYNGISSGGLISGTFAAVSGIALGFLYTYAVALGSSALLSMSSRANEIRTDIRAVEMTQDVGGYISALERVSSKVDGQCPKGSEKDVKRRWLFDTHPSFEMGKRHVLRATESKR